MILLDIVSILNLSISLLLPLPPLSLSLSLSLFSLSPFPPPPFSLSLSLSLSLSPHYQRRSIEHPILKTKKLDLGEPQAILSLALQPPSLTEIEKSVTRLKELGALTTTCGGVVNPYDGDLTFVGAVLEALPISARLGRLLLLGYVFNCLEECLVIAAALSNRSIFTKPFLNEMQAFRCSKFMYLSISRILPRTEEE